ncbi:MAG: hypothetical protein K8T90_18210 [Planctomycetes bacterium]|nr:hypothetical protein [Planctomycetota bacterium]
MDPAVHPRSEVPAGRPSFRFLSCILGRRDVVAAALSCSAAAVMCGGCKSNDADFDPMSQGSVVIGTANPKGETRSTSDAYVAAERALAQAEAAMRAGDPLTAVALANQAMREGVPAEFEQRLRELRVRARSAVVTEKIVKLRAVPVKDVVTDGDPAPVRIVLRNLSTAELRSPRREGDSSDALFVLQISREDRDVYGNVKTSEFTLRAPVTQDLAIPPGGERDVSVTIGADLVKLSHEGFSVFRIAGSFRPVAIRVGETEFFDALPIEPAIVRVFQKGYEPMAVDPLASLRKAVAKRSPPHVLVAAELLAPSEREEGREVLRGAIEKDEPLAFVLRAALTRLDQLDAPAGGPKP